MADQETALTITADESQPIVVSLTTQDIKNQVQQIQHLMKEIMQKDQHFGAIPGCGPKPALLKPGAEKLCMMFRLSPDFDIEKTDLENGHREYQITTTLTHVGTDEVYGQGVGCCSTMEKKYRYRGGHEHPDIADTYNTVLKMAKKRSLVDAVLTATAASDIFTQDIEENADAANTGDRVQVGVLSSLAADLMLHCADLIESPEEMERFKERFRPRVGLLDTKQQKLIGEAVKAKDKQLAENGGDAE